MSVYYHCTSKEIANQILKYGFHKGKDGCYGPGIYFADKPIGSLMKARAQTKNAIIAVQLNLKRCKYEESPQNHWNEEIVRNMGYDSVMTRFKRSRNEVCVYDPNQITIIAIVDWDFYEATFNFLRKVELDFLDFDFLMDLQNGMRKISIVMNGNPAMKNVEKLNEYNSQVDQIRFYRGTLLSIGMCFKH